MPQSRGKTAAGVPVDILCLPDGTVCFAPSCDGVKERVENLNLPAGASNINCTPVPVGEIYEVEAIGYSYTGTVAPVVLIVAISSGGVDYRLDRKAGPASAAIYALLGRWTMIAGDFLKLSITGATLNDDAFIYFIGRKFDTP